MFDFRQRVRQVRREVDVVASHLYEHKMTYTAGNTKGGSITVPFDLLFDWFGISCMTTDNFCFISKTDLSKPVKQEVNGTVIFPPLVFLV
jgi:hypothetical protein